MNIRVGLNLSPGIILHTICLTFVTTLVQIQLRVSIHMRIQIGNAQSLGILIDECLRGFVPTPDLMIGFF